MVLLIKIVQKKQGGIFLIQAKKIWRGIYPPVLYSIGLQGASLLFSYFLLAFCTASASGETAVNTVRSQASYLIGQTSNYLYMVVASIAILIMTYRYWSDRQKSEKTHRFSWGIFPLLLVIPTAIASCVFFNLLFSILPLYEWFPLPHSSSTASSPYWQELLVTCIIAPIAEELAFRVLCFRRLRNTISFWPAALISSIIFGVAHLNISQGIYAFCLGMITAWLYERSQNLWVTILFHITANLSSNFVMGAIPDNLILGWMITICTAVGTLLLLLLYLFQHHIERRIPRKHTLWN